MSRDGSHLCLACGLCCHGLLHDRAQLEPGEIEPMERLGLKSFVQHDGLAFRLPCPRHQDGRCTIYEERPAACRGFQCKLLRRYLAGEISAEDSLVRIEQVKRLLADIRRRMDAGEDGTCVDGISVWHQLHAFEEASQASARRQAGPDIASLGENQNAFAIRMGSEAHG